MSYRHVDGWKAIDTQQLVGEKVAKKLRKHEDDFLDDDEEERNKGLGEKLRDADEFTRDDD